MQDSISAPQLIEVVRSYIVPIIENKGVECMTLAQPLAASMIAAEGLEVRKRKRRGRGGSVRGAKQQILTRWPEDHQIALRLPYCCFVFSGEADFCIGDAILQCPQGHGILIPPGTPISDGTMPHWEREHPENAAADVLWIKFHPFGVECHTCHTRGTAHYGGGFGERSLISDSQFFGLCELLMDEMNYRRAGFQTLSRAYLLALFALLHRHLEHDEALPRQKLKPDTIAREEMVMTGPEATLRRAQNYIQNNLGNPLTLQEIAHASYISRAKLAALFREETGQTVWDYLTVRRIEAAKSLLNETDMTIENVGRLIGFPNLSHFCTRFMKVAGQAPGEYRRQSRDINVPDNTLKSGRNKKRN